MCSIYVQRPSDARINKYTYIKCLAHRFKKTPSKKQKKRSIVTCIVGKSLARLPIKQRIAMPSANLPGEAVLTGSDTWTT